MHAAVLTAFLFALTGVCATQASRLLGAARANLWRLLLALLILGIWAHGFGEGFGGGVVTWFALAGGIGFGLGGWCMLQALRRIGSTLSLLVVECAAAVLAAAIAWIWLGAALGRWEILFALLILFGVVLGSTSAPIPSLPRRAIWIGCGLALLAALFQAISFNLSRHAFLLVRDLGETLSPLTAAYQRLCGGAVVALLLYGITRLVMQWRQFPHNTPRNTPFPVENTRLPAPVWVFGNALFGPVLGVTCMLWAIRMVPNPGLVQAIAATATLITIPLARRLEGARPRTRYFLGCACALLGATGLFLM